MKQPDKSAPGVLEVLDTKQAAQWLKVSVRTIQRKYKTIPGQPGRYLVADLLEQIYGTGAWGWTRGNGKAA